ncbi:hypothetical protein MOJ79_03830, partial [Calidifontimicrobium sp. SYSU G02091]|nr:hypothetical protein [Calidifontimicrobium sp. SYSU G02091]
MFPSSARPDARVSPSELPPTATGATALRPDHERARRGRWLPRLPRARRPRPAGPSKPGLRTRPARFVARLLSTACGLAAAWLPVAGAHAAVYGTTQASYGGGQGVQLWTLDLGAGPGGSQANFYASLANPAA